MEQRSTGTVIEFPTVGPRGWAIQASADEDRFVMARRLATEIADAADADQWSISFDGVDVIGPADLDDIVPRRLLQLLNNGKTATYRLTIPLSVAGRDLGVIRLATIRPGGFRPTNIAKGYQAAHRAAVLLEATESMRDRGGRHSGASSRPRRRGQRGNLHLCQPWPSNWTLPPDAC
jgi:hypothetical protein